MAIGSLATEVSVDLLLTRPSPVLSPIRSVTALVDLSLGVVRPRDGRCPWRTTSLRALLREDLGVLWVDILRLFDVTCHPDCVVRRAYPATVCRVARGRLIHLLDRHSSVLIEGKLRGARIFAAALHLCDGELIGPLRPQSIAQKVRLPARRYHSPGGRSEPYG